MKKRIFLLLLCVLTLTVSLCLFTACKKEKNPDGGEEENNHTHSFTVKIISSEYLQSPATANTDAFFYCKCAECDEKGGGYFYHSEGLEFSLSADKSYFVVSNIGECSDNYVVIPFAYLGLPIKGIGAHAFSDNDTLTEVVIPNTVEAIGEFAFSGCDKLTNIVIPDSVKGIGASAFYSCYALKSINFGAASQLSAIATAAFKDCIGLASVTIPENVEVIGYEAFSGCTGLTEINFNATKCTIPLKDYQYASNVFTYAGKSSGGITVKFGDNVTSVPAYLFYSSSLAPNVKAVVMSNGIKNIGTKAFMGCAGLTSVVIPNSVTSIGDFAFENCYKLVEVINKSTLTITKGSSDNGYVGYYALEIHNGESKIVNKDGYLFYTVYWINYLVDYVGTDTELTLPSNYYSYQIYKYAFYVNDKITNVVIPNVVTSIGDYAFSSCTSLTSVVIPDSVTSIGSSAFYGCTSLANVVIPNGVTSIADYAFSSCTSLTSVVIPDSVTTIGKGAFSSCTSLTSVTIPNNVTSIGSSAFSGCNSLTSIKYRGTETQWNAISKGYGWNNNTGNYTVTYNYTGE